jgi:membrane protease YdiL (CAAX protease family)
MTPPEHVPEVTLPEVPEITPPTVSRKPRVWTVFVTYSAAIVMMLLLAVALFLAVVVGGGLPVESAVSSPVILFGLMLGSFVAMAGAALTSTWLSPTPWRQRLRLLDVPMQPLALIVGVLGVLGIGMTFDSLNGLGLIPSSPTLDYISAAMRELSPFGLAVANLAIGILPGTGEELLFRGYIQTRLCARWGMQRGIACTALMFGVIHFDLVQGTYAVIIGLFLGYMTERYGSILPAIIIHATNNTASGFLFGHLAGRLANGLGLVIGLAITGASFLYLRERLPLFPNSDWRAAGL